MRTKEVNLAGRTYLMTNSTGVMIGMREAGIDLSSVTDVGDVLKVIAMMINAGSLYAEIAGLPEYPSITTDQLGVMVGMDDISDLTSAMAEVIKGDRSVVAEPPAKNAATTPGRAS